MTGTGPDGAGMLLPAGGSRTTPRRGTSAMPDPALVRVAAVRLEPKLGDHVANLSAILQKLEEAANAGARLVVFPECGLSGYGFDSKEEGLRHAEPIPGPSTRAVADACSRNGAFAIYGLLER